MDKHNLKMEDQAKRIEELEVLAWELMHWLGFMLGDKSTRIDWLVEVGKTYSKAKEVLGG